MRIWHIAVAFVLGLAALPLGAGMFALSGWLQIDARTEPPGFEKAIAHRALHASLDSRARGLHNPVAANDSAALLAGAKLFRDNCAGCHGGAQADSAWGARNFYPRVPQFWREEHEHMLTPEETFVVIRDGIRYSGMGGWNGMLKEEQMWQLANFVSGMHNLPPEVQQAWKTK